MSWSCHTAFESTSMSRKSMVSHNHTKKQRYIAMSTLDVMQVLSAGSRVSPAQAMLVSCFYIPQGHTHPWLQVLFVHSSLFSLLYQTVLKKLFQNFHFPWSYCSLLTWYQSPVLFFIPQSTDKGREILLSLYRFSFLKYIANYHFCSFSLRIFTKTSKHQHKRDIVPPSLLPHLLLVLLLNSARKILYRNFLIRVCSFLSNCTFKSTKMLWEHPLSHGNAEAGFLKILSTDLF